MPRTIIPRSTALAALCAALVAPHLCAQQQISSKAPMAFNRFYDFDELGAQLRAIAAAYPRLVTVDSIGRSELGREMWLVTLNNADTGPAADKPAMYIDGSIHANEIQASETVLYSIWYLASAHGQVAALTELIDRSVFYFVPCVNPDGRAGWFADAHSPNSNRTGLKPTDSDGDGLFDEDAPDDLDGDGSIGSMWRPDVNGTHRRDPDDPRIFVRVEPPSKGEWSQAGSEGIDNDGDGQINEDGGGGYDMNRNWPSDWQPDWVQQGAGNHPFSYSETRAIGTFVLAHPNIAAGQAYHNAGGMILRGPGASYRQNQYPRADIAVYDEIAKAGEEMLPFYRSMIIFSDLYTVHGGFVNWLAEGLGIVAFTNELWNDRRILQNGQTPADDKARFRWQDRVLFGRTFSEWKEVEHPDYGTVLIGGGNKWSSRIPPPFMLEEECHRNFAFTVFHAQQMPKLSWERREVKRLGPTLWQVTIEVANGGLIPTRTARAAEKRSGAPDFLECSGTNVRVVTAGTMNRFVDRTFQPVEHRPQRLAVEGGVSGRGRGTWRFLIEAPEGAMARFEYRAEKATDISTDVALNP